MNNSTDTISIQSIRTDRFRLRAEQQGDVRGPVELTFLLEIETQH